DWSSDVCSSDLDRGQAPRRLRRPQDRFETTRKERQEKRGKPPPRGSAGLQVSPAPAPRNRILVRSLLGQEQLGGLLQVLMSEGTDVAGHCDAVTVDQPRLRHSRDAIEAAHPLKAVEEDRIGRLVLF